MIVVVVSDCDSVVVAIVICAEHWEVRNDSKSAANSIVKER